jgi:glycosyltransferase involved in cell wall biosynthesis
MDKPLVTIVIPYFNKEKTIIRALSCIYNQTYTNWELILIDDCSKKPINEIVTILDNNVTILKNEQNIGPGPTRQRGLDIAKGEFVAFLDADDWWSNDFLFESIKTLQLDIDLKYAGSWSISETRYKDRTELRRYSDLNLEDIRKTILKYPRPWQTGSILWRRKMCGYWGDLSTNQDYFFELTSALKNNRLVKINKVLYFVDQTQGNHRIDLVSKEKQLSNTFNLYSYLHNNQLKSLDFFSRQLLLNRQIRAMLKIAEQGSNSDYKAIFWKKIENQYPLSKILLRSVVGLKITHKLLQNSPFKIYT